jgi:ABC-type sugar transport system ATPase subunit
MNFIDGKVAALGKDHIEIQLSNGCRSRACVESGDLKVGDPVTLGVRPEHIEERSDAGTLLSGDVTLVERLGEASFIYLTLGDGTEIVVRGSGESTVTTAQRIEVSFAPHSAHVFDSNDRALRRLQAGNVHSTAQLAQLKAVAQDAI